VAGVCSRIVCCHLKEETDVSKRNVLVLGVVLCAMLAMGFVAGKAATKTPVPPFTLTAVPITQEFSSPTFLLTDSQSATVRVLALRYARNFDPNWAEATLQDNGLVLAVWAQFDLAKLPAAGPAGEGAETTPPPKP
jgi:hypothetical protein